VNLHPQKFLRQKNLGKEFLFSFYWVIVPTLGLLAIGISAIYFALNVSIIGTIVGGCLGCCYFIQKQNLEEATFFRSVFTTFNERYDRLNNELMKVIATRKIGDCRASLIDYFNLCAEEYLLYKRGYIPSEVWESWLAGMFQYWSIFVVFFFC